MQLVYETLVVGLGTAVIGVLVTVAWFGALKALLSKSDWNKFYPGYDSLNDTQRMTYLGIFAVILFLTGVTIHLSAEVSGVNKWYCKNGAACRK